MTIKSHEMSFAMKANGHHVLDDNIITNVRNMTIQGAQPSEVLTYLYSTRVTF